MVKFRKYCCIWRRVHKKYRHEGDSIRVQPHKVHYCNVIVQYNLYTDVRNIDPLKQCQS